MPEATPVGLPVGIPGGYSPRILVAGMGNVLRQDDGFGIAVARRLAEDPRLPPGVTVLEAGIAGVRLVQELMDGYDALVIVDAVIRGGPPGTLYALVPQLSAVATQGAAPAPAPTPAPAPDSLHTVEPSQVLTLARAAGCLPPRVLIVGCEPLDCDELSLDLALTPAVAAAVPRALALIRERIASWRASC